MKKVSDLLPCSYDINILGITNDSREVKEGYLFVATKGFYEDHFDYIDDAIQRGCSFVVCDREFDNYFPHFVVEDVNSVYNELCKKYYDITLEEFQFIGITGTDGKTTSTTILKELLGDYAYLGTNGLEICDKSYVTHNTTPCVSELYQDLAIVKENGCSKVCMEVSSEALLHNRIAGFQYEMIGFTNITGDHLNIHKTFEEYVACKMKLLEYVKPDGYVVINGDDYYLRKISHPNLKTFGFQEDNDFVIRDVSYFTNFTKIVLEYQNLQFVIESPFHGKYNVYNVVMAFSMAYLFGVDDSLLISKIKELRPIKGRCEFLDFGQKYDIVLDYAHTINGVYSILNSFKNYENIIVVTGCAGGREKEKRKEIGKIVMENSDVAIFTMDDPRFEDVDDIIDQMVGDKKEYFRIVDREEVIQYALSIACPGSVVLILGKGRDNYMAIGDKKIRYCDYDVIMNYFR